MNPRIRRTRTEADIVVLRRELVDPRQVCIRCYALCGKAVLCDNCRPRTNTEVTP